MTLSCLTESAGYSNHLSEEYYVECVWKWLIENIANILSKNFLKKSMIRMVRFTKFVRCGQFISWEMKGDENGDYELSTNITKY